MQRRSRLDQARRRLAQLVRLQQPDDSRIAREGEPQMADEPQIEIFPVSPNGRLAERGRELMQRPEFQQFRHRK